MPKYRKLHTKTVESLDLNEMPDDLTRLMWVLLPLALCREGRGLHSGAWLKSKLFPLREDINSELVWQKFQWFVGRGMVVPYEVEGRSYFYVPTFHKYQGNTVKEAESDYPPPPDLVETSADETDVELPTDSEPTPELVQSKSGTDAVFSIQYSDAEAREGADAPTPDPPPPKKREPKAKDPPPAAVARYRSLTRLYPEKALWSGIAEVVGDNPADLDRFEKTVKSWMACGWNKRNVKGMLQFYVENRLPGDNHARASPNQEPEPKGFAGIRAWMEKQEASSA